MNNLTYLVAIKSDLTYTIRPYELKLSDNVYKVAAQWAQLNNFTSIYFLDEVGYDRAGKLKDENFISFCKENCYKVW